MLFGDCTLEKLDKLFNLKPVTKMTILETWLKEPAEISEQERNYLAILQDSLRENVDNWNEYELALYFIGPMFTLVNFNYQRQFNLFGERPLSGLVEGIEIKGKPDGMIATGYREPEKPYFCFQEYKKDKDPNGDPQAQVLAAMLVAQELNEYQFPLYGCYVRGRLWFFMTLQGKEYVTSDGYLATRDDIFDILRILKALKQLIIRRVTQK